MEEKKWYIETREKHVDRTLNEYLLSQGMNIDPEIYHLADGTPKTVIYIPQEKIIQEILSDGDKRKAAHFYTLASKEDFLRAASIEDAYQLVGGHLGSDAKIPEYFKAKAQKNYTWGILKQIKSITDIAKNKGEKIVRTVKLEEKYDKEILTLADLKDRDRKLKDKLTDIYSNVSLKKFRSNYYFFVDISD